MSRLPLQPAYDGSYISDEHFQRVIHISEKEALRLVHKSYELSQLFRLINKCFLFLPCHEYDCKFDEYQSKKQRGKNKGFSSDWEAFGAKPGMVCVYNHDGEHSLWIKK